MLIANPCKVAKLPTWAKIRGDQWQSLSVPAGGAEAYNAANFAQPQRREYFTDEFLEDKE